MKPPTAVLAALVTLQEVRSELSVVPRLVAIGELEHARQVVDECRAQLAEMLGELRPVDGAGLPLSTAPQQPLLSRPGGRPSEPLDDSPELPLW